LNDADLEDTVTNVISAAFGSAGERCMACAVVTVEEGIADGFLAALRTAAQNVKIGNGVDDGVFPGPVIREENQKRTIAYIEKGLEEGAKLTVDGRETGLSEGHFVGPTILEDVTTDMTIWKDEIFAPVLSVIRVKNLQEAVRVANQSEFANGACIFTNN
ncbi:aldehyde dehydrogenase family protein, partial [Clostridioides difficile]|uniref:aldehyde dehydrogenase family protein n=1 Tax=Clostridioides difficile TaxID=1496 RepID=UPI002358239F